MPAEITVSTRDLLDVLQENRRNHHATYFQAMKGYRQHVIAELETRLADIRDGGKINLDFDLPRPEDHTSDYDREIRMLQMHTGDTIEIESYLFDQVVMDRWSWSRDFKLSSSMYLDGKR